MRRRRPRIRSIVYKSDFQIEGHRVIDLRGREADIREVVNQLTSSSLPVSQPPRTALQAAPGAYRLLIREGDLPVVEAKLFNLIYPA